MGESKRQAKQATELGINAAEKLIEFKRNIITRVNKISAPENATIGIA